MDKKFNKYIRNTFELFASNKHEIRIDLPKLDKYNKHDDGQLVNLIINELTAFDFNGGYKMNVKNTNILTPQLFNIFPKINSVFIEASDYGEHKNYIFSLFELLSVIKDTTVNTVLFNGDWIKKLKESSSEIITKAYAIENFSITMDNHGIVLIKRTQISDFQREFLATTQVF